MNQTEEYYAVACIPAYNEAASIGDVIDRCREYVDVVVVCDDGSMDDTAGISESCFPRVVINKTNPRVGAPQPYPF